MLCEHRVSPGISQSKLARLSHVSRFRICVFELGNGELSADEQHRIRLALHAEVERLRRISPDVQFSGQTTTSPAKAMVHISQSLEANTDTAKATNRRENAIGRSNRTEVSE